MANLNITDIAPTNIQNFYNNSVILITGCTGYIGKCLLYKLLYTCRDIKKIYLIVRHKKSKSLQERIDEICNSEIYEGLKKDFPNFRDSLAIIEGDLEEENLGISEENRRIIINEVNIIFHVAATVRFDENIKTAAKINIIATRDLLRLSKQIQNLKAILHVSTAFSHCYKREIKEKFYNTIRDPYEFVRYVENTSREYLDNETASIIGDYPNTYTFTKGLTEELVRRESENDLPIAIFRPSIVIGSNQEPIPGWIDNLYGPNGLALGTGVGLIHVIAGGGNVKSDVVPVDFVVNGMIVATWKASQRDCKKPIEIYNYVSGNKNPITWDIYRFWAMKYVTAYYTIHSFWYSFVLITANQHIYKICNLFFHTLPALLVDTILKILHKKPKMQKIYEKIDKVMNLLSYFGSQQWDFEDENTTKLWNELSDRNKQLYPFNIQMIEWDQFIYHSVRFMRIYFLKDPLSTVPIAQRKMKRLKFLHYTLRNVLIILVCYLFYIIFKRIFL